MNSEPVQEQGPVMVPKGNSKKIWLIIVGVLLILAYAGLFIPAFAGQPINPSAGPGILVWNAWFFFLLWKHFGRRGWVGSLLGALIGVFAFFLAGVHPETPVFVRRGHSGGKTNARSAGFRNC
ncbi:hypothetical protein [Syntrophotalea acetylenica]|uniref:Uncharacterized protein n=1 Tax=Syntrophotalea acetylenica TaxID=29542 RepID=A0A1L3GEU3_SYNAC|nr:hypothetical protein [Syntrophotalea acetylenica]APG24349.1 hypothetical protein A7E75_04345 [Syntrophotalea acetylenica]APG44930.1 hypothetical protein A6070_12980 [Syntrophotalea acetylenica]